jgi:nuclear protein 1
MSGAQEEHEVPVDEFEHYNYEQERLVTGHGGEWAPHTATLPHPGKQRSKKEAEMNTNRHNPGGHERKIVTKLMNAEKNQKAGTGGASAKS